MLLLADTPTAAAGLVAPSALRRLAEGGVPAHLDDVWRRLTGGTTAWSGELFVPHDAHAPDRSLLVVEHASGSQFTTLQAALRDGARLPQDLACLALAGSGFRGQRGRAWEALRGNLHLILLAQLDLPAASVQTALTALPAVATARAIEGATRGRVRPGLKWVNDLLLAERKIGGVLSATQLLGGRVTYALVGIGVNVARSPDVPRHPSLPPTGSLAGLAGAAAPSLTELTLALLVELDVAVAQLRSGGGSELVEDYRRRSVVVGRRVAIWPVNDGAMAAEPLATGRVLALRPDLGLELEGYDEPVYAGRLTLLEGDGSVEHGTAEDG